MALPRPDTLEAALSRVFEGRKNTRASWFALTGGERLFAAGDEADTLYLLRAGRLGVFQHEPEQPPRFLGVIRPGEPVGEMALVAGTPHTASVVALRDSEVLALPRDAFFEAARAEPDLMVELARLMIQRARDRSAGATRPNVFGFISARPRPIRNGVERVAAAVRAMGFSCHIIDQSALSSAAEWFSRVEDSHDFVLYVAEQDEAVWASLCARQVDRLFVVGDATLAPPLSLPHRTGEAESRLLTDLILLRDPRMQRPANTAVWLDALKPGRWFHAIEGDSRDTARIARIITGTAVGLVLSGGGARAYTHIGAIKALREAGAPIDFIGGASMGAIVGAGPALGWDDEEIESRIRRAFVHSDPLSDIAFPLIAMTHARKVAVLLEDAYGDIDIADMPLPFFAVSSNLTSGKVEVHRRGLLRRALRASSAIPGVMPPVVIDGQVLVDGAVIKNFPTDVMRQLNAGPLIGVDVSQTRGVDPASLEDPPSWWRWLLSGAWKRGPPIVAILMRSATVTSDVELQRARQDADVLIQPSPDGIDIRDWKAYDPAVTAGYEATRAALADLNGPVSTLHLRSEADRSPVDTSAEAESHLSSSGVAPPQTDAGTAAGSHRRRGAEKPLKAARKARKEKPTA